eukprot:EG_transcript_13091
MPDPGPGAEAIQAGILRMCHQLAAVQALLQQDPGNAAAATLSEGIAAGIRKNQAVLLRKYGVRLEALPEQPAGAAGGGRDPRPELPETEAAEAEEEEAEEGEQTESSLSSSSSDEGVGVPAGRGGRPGSASEASPASPASPRYSLGWWTKGEAVAARPDWSAPLLGAAGFAGWTAATNGVALRLMRAMGFQEGKGLGRREDGIAFPLQSYEPPRTGRAVGLGHAQRQPQEQAADGPAGERKRKRRRRKLKATLSAKAEEEEDGSLMFSLVNKLSKARDGDEAKEQAFDARVAGKQAEYRTYRTLPGAELQRVLAGKLRVKDRLADEIRRLTAALTKAGTAAHSTSAAIERKRAVLRTVTQDVAVLTRLTGERARQLKSLAF